MSPSRSPCTMFFSSNNGQVSSGAAVLATAIVRSEKTHTLACNECHVPMCHRAVRKDTHAGLQRVPCADLVRAVRKDTHAGLQRIPAAAMFSCGQKRHTRSSATAGSLITDSILPSSHTAALHVSADAGKRCDPFPRNGFDDPAN